MKTLERVKKLIILLVSISVIAGCMPDKKPAVSKIKEIDIDSLTHHGIDVSQYQGDIDWSKIDLLDNKYKITFVIIRSSCGDNFKDNKFDYNWKKAKEEGFVRGAYHYYRPDENSKKQAENFIKHVKLEKGDLPPVLDIEKKSSVQDIKSLRQGLLNWMKIIEKHYGCKPILYTEEGFYNNNLKGYFDEYPLWISFLSLKRQPITGKGWELWQYGDKGQVDGIKGRVDQDVFYYSLMDGLLIQ